MQWGTQRQILYAVGVLVLILALSGIAWLVFFHRAPTCMDGTRNQDEEGIDCGGVCAPLCVAPEASVVWARSVKVAEGVYHAVALVRNPRTDAGVSDLPYSVKVLDEKSVLIAEVTGTLALEPGETAPLFVPNILTGTRIPSRTFVSFGAGHWRTQERPEDPLIVRSIDLEESALRLTATIENTTAVPVGRTVITVLLYDAEGTLIAASQTFVNGIPARGSESAFFTWQLPFTSPVVRTEVITEPDSR